MAIGMMFGLSRKICSSDRDVRKAIWSKRKGFLISKKIVGVIGLGLIGQNLIKRLKGFDLEILGNDIRPELKKNKNLKKLNLFQKI